MKAVIAPRATLWRVANFPDRKLEPILSPSDLQDHAPPLVFIHGVEFENPEEALNDLVVPMLKHLGEDKLQHRSIYVLFWSSLIVPRDISNSFFAAKPAKKLITGLLELLKCRRYMLDVEQRAKAAAIDLCPYILEWNSQARSGPVVITHSMGGLVWVEALKRILESSTMLVRPGIWWSLQPAIKRRSFTDSGEYKMISKLYTGHESARALIWYSRFDFILSSLYLLSTRTLALGQFGCPAKSLPQRDVTSIVGEAHGMSHLARIKGDFFKRAGQMIASEAANLGII